MRRRVLSASSSTARRCRARPRCARMADLPLCAGPGHCDRDHVEVPRSVTQGRNAACTTSLACPALTMTQRST